MRKEQSTNLFLPSTPPVAERHLLFHSFFILFFLTFAHSTHHPRLEPALGEDLRQPYARTFYACIAQCPHSRSKREPFPSLSPPPHPVPPTHHERAPQPNYIKTRRFAGPLTWSTPTALMYAAQPNGADSATINPAALASQGMFVSFPLSLPAYHRFGFPATSAPALAQRLLIDEHFVCRAPATA